MVGTHVASTRGKLPCCRKERFQTGSAADFMSYALPNQLSHRLSTFGAEPPKCVPLFFGKLDLRPYHDIMISD